MYSQIYLIDKNLSPAAYGSVPVVKREIKQQPAYAPEAYDDYGIGGIYWYPSFNFCMWLIAAGIIFAIVQFLFCIGAVFFMPARKKRCKCRNCGGENFAQNGKLPQICQFCGAKL